MFWNFKKNKTETKTAFSSLVTLTEPGLASWMTDHPAGLVEAGFRDNPISYRCVRLIAETAASVPVQMVSGPAALDRLLSHPGRGETGAGLLQRLYGDLQVSGNAFLEIVPGSSGYAGLLRLPPTSVSPLKKGRGLAIRMVNGLREVRPDADGWMPVLHFRALDPSGRVLAMAPLTAARHAVEIHNSGADWTKALIDNAARPSGALIYGRDGAHLTPDQFERLKSQLEDAHSGARNAGRPMLLEGGLDWKPMGLTPADMDFIEARREAAREIALAFGVPPMLLGIPGDNTYANYREANLAFWRHTILPLVQGSVKALEAWLSARGDHVQLKADLDAVPALGPEREALWNRLAAADFLSVDEKRAIAGFGPMEASHAD